MDQDIVICKLLMEIWGVVLLFSHYLNKFQIFITRGFFLKFSSSFYDTKSPILNFPQLAQNHFHFFFLVHI